MILVVSSLTDTHATVVIEELRRRGADVQLLDLSLFPRELGLTLAFDGKTAKRHLAGAGQDLDLAQCRVVWWRRPQLYGVHDDVHSEVDRAFAYAECDAAISGLWHTLDAYWINDPTRDQVASRKVYQLALAQEMGLRIPRTCITNDPREARAFIDAQGSGKTIYKAFGGTERAWRETRLLRADEMNLMESVRYAPVIFQEHIPAAADLRITVVGDEIFPAAIRVAGDAYAFDFRMAMDSARIEATRLPTWLQKKLLAYVQHLGLVYGAIDMRLTPDGEHVFLEINPAGQWLFIEQETQQPISAAMAALMVRRDTLSS